MWLLEGFPQAEPVKVINPFGIKKVQQGCKPLTLNAASPWHKVERRETFALAR